MEVVQEIIRESVSGGFWKFIGYIMMTTLIFVAPVATLAEGLKYLSKGRSKK